MDKENSCLNVIKKDVISVEQFTFDEIDHIQNIVLIKDKKEIEQEWLNQNIDDEYYDSIIKPKFLSNLKINYNILGDELVKEKAINYFKAIKDNYYGNIKKNKLWMLSEMLIPIMIIKSHINLELIWCNQFLNADSNNKKPANGLDFAITQKNDKKLDIIFGEVKSSISSQKAYKDNIKKSLQPKGFLKYNYDKEALSNLKSKILFSIQQDMKHESLNWDSQKFIVGGFWLFSPSWTFERVINSLDINSKFQNTKISLFEIYIKNNE